MSKENDDVRAFHIRFSVPMNAQPGPMEPTTQDFRIRFLREELEEYERAIEAGDMATAFDSLIDLVYVAHGAALIHGFPWEQGWRRVQNANMAKVTAAELGIPGRHPTDVVKPEGWTAPDLSDLVAPKPKIPAPLWDDTP